MNPFARHDKFENRHIGTIGADLVDMLKTIGVQSLDQLIEQTVPDGIRLKDPMKIPQALSEFDY